MNEWTSWAVVNTNPDDRLHEELMALPGMGDGRDIPLFSGTLGEFCEVYKKPFTAHREGRYIELENRND